MPILNPMFSHGCSDGRGEFSGDALHQASHRSNDWTLVTDKNKKKGKLNKPISNFKVIRNQTVVEAPPPVVAPKKTLVQ